MSAAPWPATLLSVGAVSAVPLVLALLIPRGPQALQRALRPLVAFATGALLGAAFLHMIPESFAGTTATTLPSALVLVGFLIFFALERSIWRHRHGDGTGPIGPLPPVAALNLLGDAVHNTLDGMAIAAAFLTDYALGVTTSVAVLLHEVPQEIGDYGVLLHSGLGRRRAILWNVATALTAFTGAVLVLVVGGHVSGFGQKVVPLAAGGFIYIAAADLVPELNKDLSGREASRTLLAVALGVLLTSLPLFFETR